jgi:diguanylate cyclase (GGDEF)-like protein/PAS domain S-box-containing protein
MPHKANFYKEILDNLNEGVYFVDRARLITYWNRGAERITGYSSERVIGHSCYDNLLIHIDDAGTLLCKNSCPLVSTLNDGQCHEANVYLHHAKGHRVSVKIRVAPIYNEAGEISGAVETFYDNSSMLAALQRADELEEAAFRDPLTGVGNRRYLELKLASYLGEFKQHGLNLGLLFIDIDNFKAVNDTYGHAVGDQLLKVVADTLRHNVRSFDLVTRLGGEEFIVVLLNLNEEQLQAIAQKLLMLVANSQVETGKDQLRVTISVGATLAQQDDTIETLIDRADQLMYRSKVTGKNRVTFLADKETDLQVTD